MLLIKLGGDGGGGVSGPEMRKARASLQSCQGLFWGQGGGREVCHIMNILVGVLIKVTVTEKRNSWGNTWNILNLALGRWRFSSLPDDPAGSEATVWFGVKRSGRMCGDRNDIILRMTLAETLPKTNRRYTKEFSLCPYVVSKPQHLSSVHNRYPAIYVAILSRLVRAAILKSEGVFAVFSRNLNTLKKFFQDLMLRESRRVFASAYELGDIQRLIWNFQSENSTRKLLLLAKQKLQLT